MIRSDFDLVSDWFFHLQKSIRDNPEWWKQQMLDFDPKSHDKYTLLIYDGITNPPYRGPEDVSLARWVAVVDHHTLSAPLQDCDNLTGYRIYLVSEAITDIYRDINVILEPPSQSVCSIV